MNFSGIWTAIVTPFKKEGGIDWNAFEKLLQEQIKAKVSGIVVTGTTGEAPTLSTEEKIELVKFSKKNLPSSIKVMAGSGGNSTEDSVKLSYILQEAGADCLLIVTPPYNKPTVRGIVAHFEEISSHVNIPLVLYHVPGRTNIKLTANAIADVCSVKNVEAVKEASGDIALFSRAKIVTEEKNKGKNIAFLSGDDPTYLASLSVGGVGCISVLSNVFPAEFVKMTDLFNEGKVKEALSYHERLLEMIDVLFCETNPTPAKACLNIAGTIENILRLPLVGVEEKNYNLIKETYLKTKKSFSL